MDLSLTLEQIAPYEGTTIHLVRVDGTEPKTPRLCANPRCMIVAEAFSASGVIAPCRTCISGNHHYPPPVRKITQASDFQVS